ncbi:hypothetical protein J2S19_001581 [Metabacillus malikii]|uniref:Beta-lactamase-related domain-containing protein n=1 Tax=Metabacillus malikii TaxID=1504265 RepID=A0ABT9ZDL7_9BACI|nr:hypothetical protein [Metabacillus malikii]
MEHTYYRYTNDLKEQTSKGYLYSGTKYEELKPTEVLPHPAGSIISTADDMAKFIIWQLNGEGILEESTLRDMQQTQYTHQKGMLGNAYGFYEGLRNNHKVIEHGGDTNDFSSLLSMHPEEKLGFFLSANSNAGGQMLREEFANEFYQYFLGEGPQRVIDSTELNQVEAMNSRQFEGHYRYGRVPQSTPLKFLNPFMGKISVHQIDNNNIRVKDDIEETIYHKIANNLYQNKADNSLLVFEKDAEGRVYMVKERYPMIGLVTGMHGTYEKMTESSVVIENSIIIPSIIALIYLVVMLISQFRKTKQKYKGHELAAKLLLIGTSTMILIETGLFALMIMKVMNNEFNFNGIMTTIHITSWLFLCLTLITTIYTGIAWKNNYWKLKGRIFHSIANIAAILMVICIVYFNGLF